MEKVSLVVNALAYVCVCVDVNMCFGVVLLPFVWHVVESVD